MQRVPTKKVVHLRRRWGTCEQGARTKHMAHCNNNIVCMAYFVGYTIEVNKTNEPIKHISSEGSKRKAILQSR